jgi:hypothetical protein
MVKNERRVDNCFRKYDYLPELRGQQAGSDADQRLPVVLRVHIVQNITQAKVGRLLRFLQLWQCEMPSDPARKALLLTRLTTV